MDYICTVVKRAENDSGAPRRTAQAVSPNERGF